MEKFFNYPLSLMQFIKNDTDKEALLKIIAFSVLNFSEKMNYQEKSVASQIIYLYYRKPHLLDRTISKDLDQMFEDGRLIEDEDYHGFAGEVFNPEQEIEGMLKEFESNAKFLHQCIIAYREYQAISLLNLNHEFKIDFRNLYNEAVHFIEAFESKHRPDAWTSVSNNIFFEVFNGSLSMDYLRLIAAVKSVLSKKNLNLTYKSVLLCRMFWL